MIFDVKEGGFMNKEYNDIGVIGIPSEFRYSETLRSGRPDHKKFDDFYRKHPFMDVSKRAKIFAPFSALKGFDKAISDKEIQYHPKVLLDETAQDELAEILSELRDLTCNSRVARENSIAVKVTYFVPCTDIFHEAYGYRGQDLTATGICMNVDDIITKTITVGNFVIPLDDIYYIEYVEE